ncbi:hypothetical protein EZV62_002527 [Acer yangbiense]|uniref:Protein kinase domain-containing protein n=1 Tax=Acer yangbiense TaxID=1000413 RepID=A0A5C7IXS9_9ROSI|nr:hypothetical protein EZV62_002527 [Acer yangbiense]
MGCFSCTGKSSKKSKEGKRDNKNSKKQGGGGGGDQRQPSSEEDSKEDQLSLDAHTVDLKDDDTSTIGKKAQTFKFQELVDATGNFNPCCFLGEGGFGKVYKGHFSDTNQEVAIKQLDPDGVQGIREFVVEARPLFKDRKNFPSMVDPLLKGQYPRRGLYQALAIAAMCVQEQPSLRPKIADVVLALNYLATQSNFVTQVYPVQSSQSNNPSHSRVNRFDATSRQTPPPRSKSN